MEFNDLIADLDQSCANELGGLAATLNPNAGGTYAITGIIQNPALTEDYVPGSAQGVSVIRFFVHVTDPTPMPVRGDAVTINAVQYDVQDIGADAGGGAVLKLRRKS